MYLLSPVNTTGNTCNVVFIGIILSCPVLPVVLESTHILGEFTIGQISILVDSNSESVKTLLSFSIVFLDKLQVFLKDGLSDIMLSTNGKYICHS